MQLCLLDVTDAKAKVVLQYKALPTIRQSNTCTMARTPRYRDDHCEPPVQRPAAEVEGAILRERPNWRIFAAFARQEYPECLQIIEEQLRECKGLAEYPIYVKGVPCVHIRPLLHQSSGAQASSVS